MCKPISFNVTADAKVWAKPGLHSHSALAQEFGLIRFMQMEYDLLTRELREVGKDGDIEMTEEMWKAARAYVEEVAGDAGRLIAYARRSFKELGQVARYLLSVPVRQAYDKAIVPAWEVYEKAKAEAWEAYDKVATAAWEAYGEAIVPAWAPHDRSPVWEAYDKAWTVAKEAYDKAWDALDKTEAWEAYGKALAAVREAFDEATGGAKETYDKAIAAARETRDRALAPAGEARDKAVAKAWIRLFRIPENRIEIWR